MAREVTLVCKTGLCGCSGDRCARQQHCTRIFNAAHDKISIRTGAEKAPEITRQRIAIVTGGQFDILQRNRSGDVSVEKTFRTVNSTQIRCFNFLRPLITSAKRDGDVVKGVFKFKPFERFTKVVEDDAHGGEQRRTGRNAFFDKRQRRIAQNCTDNCRLNI